MVKILIVNPPWPGEGYGTRSNIRWPHRRGDKVLTFPLYLAYAVAVLKKEGYDVKGIDAIDKEWGIFEFVEEIKRLKPDVVIMEVSTPSINYDLETALLLKKEVGCKLFFCGPHATYFHKDIIDNYMFVDGCIRFEFEYVIRDVCKAVKEGTGISFVQGLTFRDTSKSTIVNPDRALIEDLDGLPYVDREDFKIERYQQAFFSGKKTALIIASRGCPHRCSFCLWPETFLGHKFRARSPKNIVDEIEYLIKNYGVDELYFDDDTFIMNKDFVGTVCNEILKRDIKIKWKCMGRVNGVDSETLRLMKKAGCNEVFYGFESGSQKILDSVDKGIKKEDSINAVKMTRKAGITAGGSFVVGTPEESKETIKETIRFAIKLHADYVQFAITCPFPGTRLYEQVKKEGLLQINSWEDLDGCHGPTIKSRHLSRKELDGILRKMYIRYYLSLPVIWQNLISIRDLNSIRRIVRGIRSFLARVLYLKK